jgi:hypothetical protein
MTPFWLHKNAVQACNLDGDNFCKAHPLDSITTAAFELTDELRS